ncbi:MAG: Uncharacterized protein CEO21_164 [Microgenomates group bacterium Gr01-1014_80]|nr:MAG: Uncharacterized protein CEO21_164 [Microgenomates group bacterium Gr01-1014_80]
MILFLPDTKTPQLSDMSFDQLKKYFTSLANQKGAKAAYEVLKKANLPPNTDLHLLGHVVGNVLYKQLGSDGIKICTEDFRNACSHSIVVGLFTDKGEEALNEIKKACQKAPGGTGAYTMCFHGLGHGILAYTSYDLPKAIGICQKTDGQAEIAQCISGTIMEIISGGDHDKALWGKKRQEYLFADNPFYPCSADFMPELGKPLCYNYLTPYLWEAVGGSVNNPTESDFSKSFAQCLKIPPKDEQYKGSCFGGFGKEFTALAQDKDIRKIDQMSDEQFLKVYNWCSLAKEEEWVDACILQALSSIFWGGENDRSASIRFCKVITNPKAQKNCFVDLIGQVLFYVKDVNYRQSFCQELPDEFNLECKKRLT